MSRIDRLRSAEQLAWEQYDLLSKRYFMLADPPQQLRELRDAADRAWMTASSLLVLRESNIGAHADLSREVDAGGRNQLEHPYGGLACVRICGITYWDRGDTMIKVVRA